MMNDSCSTVIAENFGECIEQPEVIELPTYEQLLNFPPAEVMPVVAVYNFRDLTGHRKRRDNLADFSTAVTQGSTELLIDALKTAGGGTWFRVVERNGIDNLVRERQIVRSARDEHKRQNPDDEEIKEGIQPLLFAGIRDCFLDKSFYIYYIMNALFTLWCHSGYASATTN